MLVPSALQLAVLFGSTPEVIVVPISPCVLLVVLVPPSLLQRTLLLLVSILPLLSCMLLVVLVLAPLLQDALLVVLLLPLLPDLLLVIPVLLLGVLLPRLVLWLLLPDLLLVISVLLLRLNTPLFRLGLLMPVLLLSGMVLPFALLLLRIGRSGDGEKQRENGGAADPEYSHGCCCLHLSRFFYL